MSTLSDLSIQRAGLPTFAGATLVEQLVNGRDAAKVALLKYAPGFSFDEAKANQTVAVVSVWEDRNRSELNAVLSDPSATALPEKIRLTFGSDMAQQFIIAGFVQAAVGLGPWINGTIARKIQEGGNINQRWAEEDARSRLNVFASIVKMDSDGYLKNLFVAPADGVAMGLGAIPAVIVWAVVVALVAGAAVLLAYLYSTERVKENNRTMKELCEAALKAGDKDSFDKCVQALKEVQQEDAFSVGISGAVKVAAVIGVAYVAIKYGLPILLEPSRKRTYAR